METPFEVFSWTDSFAIGIEELDEQHKILVQLLNTLASSLSCQADMQSLKIIFSELAEYAVYHFQEEECLWHEFLEGDTLEAEHKRSHNNFVHIVNRLKQEGSSKPLDESIREVVSFLIVWLTSHILESDKRMARIVLAVRSGMTLEQAKQLEK